MRRSGGVAGLAELEHGDAEGRAERAFDRGEGDFAVALGEVRIGDEEFGAGGLNGEIERAAGGEVADVEIAAVDVGRDGVGFAG